MDIAARHRIADPEQLVAAVRIGGEHLRPPVQQSVQVDLAVVAGAVLQSVIELARRQGTVLDHNVVGRMLLALLGVHVPEHRDEPVAFAPDALERQIRA